MIDPGQAAPPLQVTGSRHLPAWLSEQKISLALTTYQAGKLFLIGLQPDGRLSIFERTFNRAMGLWASDQTFYLATLYQLWRFDNVLDPGQAHEGYDRLYVPQLAWTTGDIDVHDIAVEPGGRVIFANTLFGCLATVSDSRSFVPLWRPPFVSRLAAEDRCHLNGVALKDGRPAYATAISRSDVADGWRDRRADGGVVIDLATDEIVAEGLSMPHSPRWHGGRLWLLESGSGYLGYLDPAEWRFERVAFCPGYGRGLAFSGHHAIVGLSKPRHNKTFQGLALDDALTRHDGEARCGLWIVDTESGDVRHWLRLEGVVEELYDVAMLPGVRRPMALGLKSDEIQRVISMAPGAPLFS
ncbi:MAG: TIGR03032 family protein [Pseudomonadota bacterium]